MLSIRGACRDVFSGFDNILEKIVRCTITVCRVLFQTASDYVLYLARNVPIHQRRSNIIHLAYLFVELSERRSIEGQTACGHFVQQHAERPDIGARIRVPTLDLLGELYEQISKVN